MTTTNETTDGRRRWCRARANVLAGTVGLVLLTAACGGSPSSAGTAGGPSSAATGGASSAMVAAELAFARCMRAHGVADYPDPDANGQTPAGTDKKQLISNPQFTTANRACAPLIPQSVITAQNQADQRQYVSFAQCMRTHGVPNFPDPTTRRGGAPTFNLAAAGIDTTSPRIRATARNCQSLLHMAQLPRTES